MYRHSEAGFQLLQPGTVSITSERRLGRPATTSLAVPIMEAPSRQPCSPAAGQSAWTHSSPRSAGCLLEFLRQQRGLSRPDFLRSSAPAPRPLAAGSPPKAPLRAPSRQSRPLAAGCPSSRPRGVRRRSNRTAGAPAVRERRQGRAATGRDGEGGKGPKVAACHRQGSSYDARRPSVPTRGAGRLGVKL